MNAQAIATETKKSTVAAPSGPAHEDLYALPSEDEMKGDISYTTVRNLGKKELESAIKAARAIDLTDITQISTIGLTEGRAAVTMSERTASYARESDFAVLQDKVLEITNLMQELNLGDLKPRWTDRCLPKRLANRVNALLERYDSIKDSVEVSIKALSDEKIKLAQYRLALVQDIDINIEILKAFDIDIAQLELVRKAHERLVQRFLASSEGKNDEKTTMQLKKFEQDRALLEGQMNYLVSARANQYNAINYQRDLESTYNVNIQAAENQVNIARQAWSNTVSILTHTSRQKNANKGINAMRDFVSKTLEECGKATVETAVNTMQILNQGVVDVEVVKQSIANMEEAATKCLEGFKSAQVLLPQINREIMDRARQANERIAALARGQHAQGAGKADLSKAAFNPGTKMSIEELAAAAQ